MHLEVTLTLQNHTDILRLVWGIAIQMVTLRENCSPTQQIHHDGRRVSLNAFECRLVACCEWLSSVPHRPPWRLHYDFFARERGGEGGERASSSASGACSSRRRRRRNAAKLALTTPIYHIHCDGLDPISKSSITKCLQIKLM